MYKVLIIEGVVRGEGSGELRKQKHNSLSRIPADGYRIHTYPHILVPMLAQPITGGGSPRVERRPGIGDQ